MVAPSRLHYALLCLALVACGDTTPSAEGNAGDEGAASAARAPEIDGLPIIPFPVEAESSNLGRLLRHVRAALGARLPPPEVESEGVYRAWVRAEAGPWLSERAEHILVIEAHLARMEEATRVRLGIASGLAAHLYEDTARQLLDAGLPDVPIARREALRDAWADEAAPLHERALEHASRCTRLTRAAGPAFDAWHAHCGNQAAALSGEAVPGRITSEDDDASDAPEETEETEETEEAEETGEADDDAPREVRGGLL